MVIVNKKLFWRSILVLFDDERVSEVISSQKYERIVISSYQRLLLDNFSLKTKTTAVIELSQSSEEIFARFSDTTRNEINRTLKNNDLIFCHKIGVGAEDYSLYKQFEFSQQRVPVTKRQLREVIFFGAYDQGELISGIYIMTLGKYLRIRSIFSKRIKEVDKDKIKKISNASRRLIWEICLWGQQEGYYWLDLASVNFTNPRAANITKFKMSFGGRVIEEYTYTYTAGFYKKLEQLAKLKNKFLRLIFSRKK